MLNTKGNGSVSKTILGKPGNAHDFQGTVTVVNLGGDLDRETALVARNNRWNASPGRPGLKVYNGGIKHVLYIIKENRTYDEVFGDLPDRQRRSRSSAAWARRSCPTTARSPANSPCSITAT